MHQVPTPQKEHQWLHRMVGEWAVEGECSMGPDQPPMKTSGREAVRSFGGLWTVGDGSGTCESVMTLGFDPASGRFVGTFIATAMTHLWVYSGSLDAAGKVLTLDAEGPSLAGDGTLAKYQDVIEFVTDDHRTLSSRVLLPDGRWQPFMKADYRRTK